MVHQCHGLVRKMVVDQHGVGVAQSFFVFRMMMAWGVECRGLRVRWLRRGSPTATEGSAQALMLKCVLSRCGRRIGVLGRSVGLVKRLVFGGAGGDGARAGRFGQIFFLQIICLGAECGVGVRRVRKGERVSKQDQGPCNKRVRRSSRFFDKTCF